MVEDQRSPETDLQQADAEAVDVVLHDVVVSRTVALARRVSIDVSLDQVITAALSPPGIASKIFKTDEEDGMCRGISSVEDEHGFWCEVLMHEAESVHRADRCGELPRDIESQGKRVWSWSVEEEVTEAPGTGRRWRTPEDHGQTNLRLGFSLLNRRGAGGYGNALAGEKTEYVRIVMLQLSCKIASILLDEIVSREWLAGDVVQHIGTRLSRRIDSLSYEGRRILDGAYCHLG